MLIRDNYGPGKFGLSIEIFPPKTAAADAALFESLDRLTAFQPGFVSCTYGAGGSTSKRTVELCVEIQKRYGLTATSHFTCVGATRDELLDWLKFARQSGLQTSWLCAAILRPGRPTSSRSPVDCGTPTNWSHSFANTFRTWESGSPGIPKSIPKRRMRTPI